MSALESMLDRLGVVDTDTCKFRSDRYDVTFTVSTKSHEVAYAIPVTADELDALETLVRTDRETPYVEDDGESLTEALEGALGEDSIDVDAWKARVEQPRTAVEPILTSWQRLASPDDQDGDSNGSVNEDAGARQYEGEIGNARRDQDEEKSRPPTDYHVVYLPVGMEGTIAAFFEHCRQRNDRESDPFAIPADAAAATSLLSRVRAATDRTGARVVVNRRHLPVARASDD